MAQFVPNLNLVCSEVIMLYIYVWLIFIFVLLFAFVIYSIVFYLNEKNNRERQKEINDKVCEKLQNDGFQMTKVFYLADNTTDKQINIYKKMIVLDEINKKICLINYDESEMSIVGVDEILGYEIYENGGQMTTGAVISGWWAGIFSADTQGKCHDLKLIIRLKKLEKPQIVYNLIQKTFMNFGLIKTSDCYRQTIKTMQEVVSFLEVIKNEKCQK